MAEFSTFQMFFDIVIFVAITWCVFALRGYRRMVQIMTSESRVMPTDPALIKEWAKKRERLLPGSPKYIAYTNRLKEVGYQVDD